MSRPFQHRTYKPPGKDSPRARAAAAMFVCRYDQERMPPLTPEIVAEKCRVSVETARPMVEAAVESARERADMLARYRQGVVPR